MNRIARFSIITLLTLVLVIAGYFGGRSRGFDAGFNAGQQEWTRVPVYSKIYKVDTIILNASNAEIAMASADGKPMPVGSKPLGGITGQDFQPIIESIKADVMPHVWSNDPNSKIQSSVGSLSLYVTGNGSVHHEVERYLSKRMLDAQDGIVGFVDGD